MGTRKYALVLSGGGFKGAFQFGAIKYIMENGIRHSDGTVDLNPKFDLITGVSVGALNGAFMAMDNFEGLQNFWNQVQTQGSSMIYTSDFVQVDGSKVNIQFDQILKALIPHTFFGSVLEFLFDKAEFKNDIQERFNTIKSLADNTPLFNILKTEIQRSKFVVPFRMGFTSLINAQYHSPLVTDFDTDLDLAKAILASAALPIVFPPVDMVTYQGVGNVPVIAKQLTDGGVTHISPLTDAIDYIKNNDPDSDYHIIIINCSSEKEKDAGPDFNIGSYAFRVTDGLLTNEVLKTDYQNFLMINNLVEQAATAGIVLNGSDSKPLIKFKYKLIQPNDPNEIGEDTGDTLDSRKGTLFFRINKGKEIAENVMNDNSSGDWT